MKVFHYHPETGVLLGEGSADESPLEPGVWLMPAYTTDTEPPSVGDGQEAVWSSGNWLVRASTTPDPIVEPEPISNPNYVAFWDALLASTVYGSIRTQSMASLPMNTLATEFIALLGDAKAGRPGEAAIQASMSAVFATGTFTEADAEEFTEALAVGLLTDIYSLT